METEIDKPTVTDRFLGWILLPLIPRSVTPNQITAFRFGTIPFVIYLLAVGEFRWGLLLFMVSAFSDAVDGALARVRGPITAWGKMYDPLADKLLIGSVAALVVSRLLSPWLALTIILFEVAIIATAFWARKYRGVEIKAKLVGKIKMILQSFGVGFLLLYTAIGFPILVSVAWYTLGASLAFSVMSLFIYRSI